MEELREKWKKEKHFKRAQPNGFSFDKLYRKGLEDKVIDTKDRESLCNTFFFVKKNESEKAGSADHFLRKVIFLLGK